MNNSPKKMKNLKQMELNDSPSEKVFRDDEKPLQYLKSKSSRDYDHMLPQ